MSARRDLSRFASRGLAAICLVAAAVQPSAAQVLEIDAEGGVTTYAGPTLFNDDGQTLIPSVRSVPAAASPQAVAEAIASAAGRHALSPDLLHAVAWTESRYRQSAVSPKGAVGVMQLMEGAAREVGVDRFDMAQNIEGGAAYLRRLLDRYGGDTTLAVAAYNAGPGAVDRYHAVPPFRETKAYVVSVMGRLGAGSLIPVSNLIQP